MKKELGLKNYRMSKKEKSGTTMYSFWTTTKDAAYVLFLNSLLQDANEKKEDFSLEEIEPLNIHEMISFGEKPYIEEYQVMKIKKYNPNYGDDRVCVCGHKYIEHFDETKSIGCNICNCVDFIEKL